MIVNFKAEDCGGILLELDVIRERKKVTRKQLAAAAEISGSYYTQVMAGDKQGLTLSAFLKMADYLGVITLLQVQDKIK